MRRTLTAAVAALLSAATPALAAPRYTLVPGEREPSTARAAADLTELRARVDGKPDDRAARFALVRALLRAGDLDQALAAARAWRAVDAYNLVVVRLIGDILTAKGDRDGARRAYSAVVELLPKEPGAQRALASVLTQAGDLDAAYDRLRAAVALRPDDRRLGFELADVVHRRGDLADARTRFEAIAGDASVPDAVRYPAKQRLAQIYHHQRRAAAGKPADAAALDALIEGLALPGGSVNDIKVYLTWDTDRSDVDLWVTTPAGEKVYYEHKRGAGGESLYDDVTTGYGPESFSAPSAQPGEYVVQVNYYGSGRSNFGEARGEVVVVLDEGKASEAKHVLPYRLFEVGQTVRVARIQVRGKGAQ